MLVGAAGFLRPPTLAAEPFIRGDVDGDGERTLADAVVLADAIVNRRHGELPCQDAADFTDNGLVQLGDVALLLEHLVKGSPAVPEPVSAPGEDPTEDGIACERIETSTPIEDLESGYSVSVGPAPGGAGHLRFDIALSNSRPVVAGRALYRITGGWAADSDVIERRPSVELLTLLPGRALDDSVVEARIDEDGLLRLVWWISMSGDGEALDAGPRRPLFSATVCAGSTPSGSYTLEPVSAELVTAARERLVVGADGGGFSLSEGGAACPTPSLPRPREGRAYAWAEDVQVEAGGTFRLSVYGTANWESEKLKLTFLWDRAVLRATGLEKITPGDVIGSLHNALPREAPCVGPEFHTLIPEALPGHPGIGSLKLCDPCCYGNDGSWAIINARNYRRVVDSRTFWSPDIEHHFYEIIFQVRPEAKPGLVEIPFFENPRSIGASGADNAVRLCPSTCAGAVWLQVRPLLNPRIEILPSSGDVPRFIRGDVDRDGRVMLSDAVRALHLLFAGVDGTFPCEDAADSNDDGRLNMTDAVYTLGFLFGGGPPPEAPWPERGDDPTEDDLGCER